MAVGGLLMFGDDILDEVTSNILKTDGYSRILSVCIVIFIAIIPLTKIPLKYVSPPCIHTKTCLVLPPMLTTDLLALGRLSARSRFSPDSTPALWPTTRAWWGCLPSHEASGGSSSVS